ncbi:PLD nuclease N-terminal domain-containing protein [Sphingomonas daechungensis]|uniref:PLD nuclease N-terminal domain-containing protein n=1 Tax=Sphingomonas daechungensis TaxID=1176646 RepID=UPI001CB8C090
MCGISSHAAILYHCRRAAGFGGTDRCAHPGDSSPHRDPSSRLAWAVVIVVAPIIGMVAYLLLGEVRISLGRRDKGGQSRQHSPGLQARMTLSAKSPRASTERHSILAKASTAWKRRAATAPHSRQTATWRSKKWSATSTPPYRRCTCWHTSGSPITTVRRSRTR